MAAYTLDIVSATDQQTRYGYSSFDINTEQSIGSVYYYKIGHVSFSNNTLRVDLTDWTELPEDRSIWIESGVEITFIECISTLLKGYGYCTSVSHRLTKYIEVLGASETETPDELFINVNIREFDYGDEELNEERNILFSNDYDAGDDGNSFIDEIIEYGQEESDTFKNNPDIDNFAEEEVDTVVEDPEDDAGIDEDAPIYSSGLLHDYNEPEEGGSQVPPFLTIQYIYKVELTHATYRTIERHMNIPFGTVFEEIDDYSQWDLKSTITVKKTKGYQKQYTIWFYALDDQNRVLDASYVIGDLSSITGHVLPLLLKAKPQIKTPGYTVLDIISKIECQDPVAIPWDMLDEYDYGEETEEESVMDSEEDDFGSENIDKFEFEDGAYYYDFLAENMPTPKGSRLYYYIGNKINGYYDFPSDFNRLMSYVIGPVENDQVITVVEHDQDHTIKYGTVKAVVDDGSGEDIYFTINSVRANRKDYTSIRINNIIEEGNSYCYKFIDDIKEIPEYMQILTRADGYENIGTEAIFELYCETDGQLVCFCEIDVYGHVYKLGTVNVLIGIGDLGVLDAYISETNDTNKYVKIDVHDKNTEHPCTYWYNTLDIIPVRYHDMVTVDQWIQFNPDDTKIYIEPSSQLIVAECDSSNRIERFNTLVTPDKYTLGDLSINIISTNSYTKSVGLEYNTIVGTNPNNYLYKLNAPNEIRAYHQKIDNTWKEVPETKVITANPNTTITIVYMDEYDRVLGRGNVVTPTQYKDLDNIVVQLVNTSAESNRVTIKIPSATSVSQFYYNTNGIQVDHYLEFIDMNIWTRLPIGQFGSGDITQCVVVVPPNTTLMIAQTDALYNASGKGTFVTPSVYDSMEWISVTITATFKSTNKIYTSFTRKVGCNYYYKPSDANIYYLMTIDSSWAVMPADNAIVVAPGSLVTLVEVNSINQIISCCKFYTPASYEDDTPAPTPDPEPEDPTDPVVPPSPQPIPTVVEYVLNKTTVIATIPTRKVGGFSCGSCHGFTFNTAKTTGYVCKSHSVDESQRTQMFPMTQDTIKNIMSSPSITKHDIKNSSGKVENVSRHGNDVCFAKHNGTNLLFHALMNDEINDPFTLLVTNTSGVIQKKIMMKRTDDHPISFSSITYYKTDINGDLIFIVNRGTYRYDDGTFRRKYGTIRYNGTTAKQEGNVIITTTIFPSNHIGQGIYYHPEQKLLYLIFFDSSKSEVRYNHLYAFDFDNPTSDKHMYCTRHIAITGPAGGNFEIESIDMDGNTIYAALNRTGSNGDDAVCKFTIKKK